MKKTRYLKKLLPSFLSSFFYNKKFQTKKRDDIMIEKAEAEYEAELYREAKIMRDVLKIDSIEPQEFSDLK